MHENLDGSEQPLRYTRAIVDLDALRYNLDLLAARVPGSGLVPAVKADGYGHGAAAIALECESWGAQMLAVANVQEFGYLQKEGVTIPILILEELFDDEIAFALQNGAILTAGSIEYARKLSDVATRLGITATVHLNLDTGMGRMGIHPFEASNTGDAVSGIEERLAQSAVEIAELPSVTLEGIYTHFPDSDETDTGFATQQIAITKGVTAELERRGTTPRYLHIANSGALLQFPKDVAWGLVRPGVAIYGMYPSDVIDRGIGLRPVMRLESRLVKITAYQRKWTVGYGRTYPVGPGSVIGIVPVGYGDGYPRILSNRGSALVHGMRVPIAGRVSMDMIALDLTAVPEPVNRGDRVVLLGEQEWDAGGDGEGRRRGEINASELAELCSTITYEITCGFTPRIPRVYVREGRTVALNTMGDGYRRLTP